MGMQIHYLHLVRLSELMFGCLNNTLPKHAFATLFLSFNLCTLVFVFKSQIIFIIKISFKPKWFLKRIGIL